MKEGSKIEDRLNVLRKLKSLDPLTYSIPLSNCKNLEVYSVERVNNVSRLDITRHN